MQSVGALLALAWLVFEVFLYFFFGSDDMVHYQVHFGHHPKKLNPLAAVHFVVVKRKNIYCMQCTLIPCAEKNTEKIDAVRLPCLDVTYSKKYVRQTGKKVMRFTFDIVAVHLLSSLRSTRP